MSELWRDIPGYEGRYAVSESGAVFSWHREVTDRAGRTRTHGGKLLKAHVGNTGYARVCLDRKNIGVHRLVMLAFGGPPTEGQEVRHLNGDKLDNRFINLEWGTARENAADRKRHGTNAQGDTHSRTKITDEQCREVRKIHAQGISQRSLARALGVSSTCIDKIVRGERLKAIEAATRHLEPAKQ